MSDIKEPEKKITFVMDIDEYGNKVVYSISSIYYGIKLNLDNIVFVFEPYVEDGSTIWKVSYKDFLVHGKSADEALYSIANDILWDWKNLINVEESDLSNIGKQRKALLQEIVTSEEEAEPTNQKPSFNLPRFVELDEDDFEDRSIIAELEELSEDCFDHGYTFKMDGKEHSTVLWYYDDNNYTYAKYVEYKQNKKPDFEDPKLVAYYRSEQTAGYEAMKLLFAPPNFFKRDYVVDET